MASVAKCLLALLLFFAAATHAETWNAAADFSATENPKAGSPWAYGYTVGGGQFMPFQFNRTSPPGQADCDLFGQNVSYLPDMPYWTELGSIWIYPHVGKPNKGDWWNCGSWQSPQDGWLHLEPGFYITKGHRAAIQFTIPRDGCFKFLAQAILSDSRANDVIVLSFLNGVELNRKPLVGQAASANFQITRCFNQGETVMFSVDPNGDTWNKSTEMHISVVEVF